MSDDVLIQRFGIVDGKPIPLSDCSWLRIAPCGCASGVTLAMCQGEVIADSEEAAERQFSTTARELERDRKRGFTLRLITHEFWRANYKTLMECDHDPKWGIPVVPIPDGHKWAVRSGHTRQPYLHIVPEFAIIPETNSGEKIQYPQQGSKGLCGSGRDTDWWRTDWFKTDGAVQCTRCEKKATS